MSAAQTDGIGASDLDAGRKANEIAPAYLLRLPGGK